MNNNFDFNTFLLLSKNKIIISVYSENDFKKVYEKEVVVQQQLNLINYKGLDHFLNDNIFIIEKKLNNFVKKILLIIDLDEFFFVNISKSSDCINIFWLKDINFMSSSNL